MEACRVEKLTLSMEKSVIKDARRIAQEHGTSISGFFARVVKAMSGKKPPPRRTSEAQELPPLTRKMLGMISAPPGKTDRELIEEALDERYGLDR
jgi:hypothetical protein